MTRKVKYNPKRILWVDCVFEYILAIPVLELPNRIVFWIFQSWYHLTENYYIINSETIMDVNNYIPFSIINSQTIDVM